jgi:hypothetical protein
MGGWVGGWMGGWLEVKAVLRIAYSNQKEEKKVLLPAGVLKSVAHRVKMCVHSACLPVSVRVCKSTIEKAFYIKLGRITLLTII